MDYMVAPHKDLRKSFASVSTLTPEKAFLAHESYPWHFSCQAKRVCSPMWKWKAWTWTQRLYLKSRVSERREQWRGSCREAPTCGGLIGILHATGGLSEPCEICGFSFRRSTLQLWHGKTTLWHGTDTCVSVHSGAARHSTRCIWNVSASLRQY